MATMRASMMVGQMMNNKEGMLTICLTLLATILISRHLKIYSIRTVAGAMTALLKLESTEQKDVHQSLYSCKKMAKAILIR